MATYYKYQNPSEIGAAPTLDWGTVISSVNQNLQNQEQQRYENREFDKKLTNDILTKANEVSLTSDPNLNALITNMGYDTKRNVFELQKKLESGEISRSDFAIANQNTSASIGQLNQFTKTYGADYDKYLKDVQEGKTSAYADFMQKWKGGFQNFKDKKLIHNPNDGRLYVAELDAKGNVKEGPLGMVPMSTLVEVKNFNDQKIDVLAETNKYASQFKPFIEMIRLGKVETREQIENYPGFEDLVKNITESIAKNEKGYASILTDTDGTYSISGEGISIGNKIGLRNNGAGEMVPIITDEQKTRAREIVKEYIIAQTGVKETGTAVFSPSRGTGGGTGKGTKPEDKKEAPGVFPLKQNGKVVGATFQPKNIRLQEAKGITGVLNAVGLDSKGNLTMTGYNATGTETESYDAEGREISTSGGSKAVKKQKWGGKLGYLVSTSNSAQMDKYIREVINPETGNFFSGVTEAENYLRRRTQEFQAAGGVKSTTTGGFDAEAYYNSQKKKK
jgi:hypothetical protein